MFKLNFAIVVDKLTDDVLSAKYFSLLDEDDQTLLVSGMNESMNFIYTQFKLRNTGCFVKRFTAYVKTFNKKNSEKFCETLYAIDYLYGGSQYFSSHILQDSFFS